MTTATQEAPAKRIVLGERYHLENCPEIDPDPAKRPGRIERHEAVKPARPDQAIPAIPYIVTRCVTCGGQTEREKNA